MSEMRISHANEILADEFGQDEEPNHAPNRANDDDPIMDELDAWFEWHLENAAILDAVDGGILIHP